MKKKIKDLTLEEIKVICNQNHCLLADYPHCPLENVCGNFGCIREKDLEKTIEVENEKTN